MLVMVECRLNYKATGNVRYQIIESAAFNLKLSEKYQDSIGQFIIV